MSTSILFMIGLSLGANARQKYRNDLRKQLDDIAFVNPPEKMLSRLSSNNNQDSIDILEQIAQNLSGLRNLSAEAIATPIQQSLSQENGYLINEIRNLHVELRAIKDSQNERGQTVESLVHQLREELIEPMIVRLDESARLTSQASEAVSELKRELGGITASLSGAVATIQSFQQDTLKQLQEFAVSLQSILAQFRTDTREVLQQVGTEIQQAVSTSIEGMTAQRNAFEESANRAATAFEEQSRMLSAVGQETSRVMRNASDNLIATLSNIDSMLQDTRQTVQDELENFRVAYQEALQQFFTEQNNFLNETLGQQREGLASVVTDLQRTFQEEVERRKQMNEEINQTMLNIQHSVEIVNQLSTAIGMNSNERLGQLQELAREIGDEARHVERSHRQMIEQFREVSEQNHQHLKDYLAQARESYKNSFSKADQATAQICEQWEHLTYAMSNYT
jgi:ABC-type transporter Mla subunit MlaD